MGTATHLTGASSDPRSWNPFTSHRHRSLLFLFGYSHEISRRSFIYLTFTGPQTPGDCTCEHRSFYVTAAEKGKETTTLRDLDVGNSTQRRLSLRGPTNTHLGVLISELEASLDRPCKATAPRYLRPSPSHAQRSAQAAQGRHCGQPRRR